MPKKSRSVLNVLLSPKKVVQSSQHHPSNNKNAEDKEDWQSLNCYVMHSSRKYQGGEF